MAEFKLERFKYNWKGVWTTSASYNRDDVVNVGGKTYVCLITHTASADFNTDLLATVSAVIPIQQMGINGRRSKFVGTWATATQYPEGDIVTFDGSIHYCIKDTYLQLLKIIQQIGA